MAALVLRIAPARCGASFSAGPSVSAGSRRSGYPPVRTGSTRPGPLSMRVYGRLAGVISIGGFTCLRGMSVLWRERLGLTTFVTCPMHGDLARGHRRRRGRRRERLRSCGWNHGSVVSLRMAILLLVLVRVVRATKGDQRKRPCPVYIGVGRMNGAVGIALNVTHSIERSPWGTRQSVT